MTLALQWDQDAMSADIVVGSGGLQTDDGLEAAVVLSLFLDAQAPTDADLPLGAERRGYWADALAASMPEYAGSLLWLAIEKGKRSDRTLQLVRDYASQALAWMLDDGLSGKINVTAEFDPDADFLVLAVEVFGPTDQANIWKKIWRLRFGV